MRRTADRTPSPLTLVWQIHMLKCATTVTEHRLHVVLRQAWQKPPGQLQSCKTLRLPCRWSTTRMYSPGLAPASGLTGTTTKHAAPQASAPLAPIGTHNHTYPHATTAPGVWSSTAGQPGPHEGLGGLAGAQVHHADVGAPAVVRELHLGSIPLHTVIFYEDFKGTRCTEGGRAAHSSASLCPQAQLQSIM